jgi:hypothetical protein
MPSPSAETLADVEQSLGEAVKACLGLPADDRPAFIGSYLLAKLSGSELPTAPAASPSSASLGAELPALARLLSKALNVASKLTPDEPLRGLAEALTAGAAPVSSDEVRWNGSTLTQTNVKTKKERQVRQKASSCMGSLLDAFDEVVLMPDSAASRLIPLERPQKPPPPTDADSAKLHVAHAAVWDAGCSVYGGFVRDWVIRGESANDIDVSTGDYDATQRAMQQALQPYGITMQTSQPWGATLAYRKLTFVWQGSSLEVDLVDPSKVPYTPPGIDCDVGNLKIDSRGGLQLKVPELVSLEKSIKHALSKKLVFFYEPSSDMAKKRIHKYMQRGWVIKSPVPEGVGGMPQQIKTKQKYSVAFWQR